MAKPGYLPILDEELSNATLLLGFASSTGRFLRVGMDFFLDISCMMSQELERIGVPHVRLQLLWTENLMPSTIQNGYRV